VTDKVINLAEAFERIVSNKQFLLSVGKKAKDVIRKRVKSGYGVNNSASSKAVRQKLKPLSPGYIKSRRRIVLGEFGKPSRSNLTLTGEMLNSILVKVFAVKGVVLEVNRKTRRDGNTNAEIAAFTSIDRPWFNLTIPEQRIITTFIREYLIRELRRI